MQLDNYVTDGAGKPRFTEPRVGNKIVRTREGRVVLEPRTTFLPHELFDAIRSSPDPVGTARKVYEQVSKATSDEDMECARERLPEVKDSFPAKIKSKRSILAVAFLCMALSRFSCDDHSVGSRGSGDPVHDGTQVVRTYDGIEEHLDRLASDLHSISRRQLQRGVAPDNFLEKLEHLLVNLTAVETEADLRMCRAMVNDRELSDWLPSCLVDMRPWCWVIFALLLLCGSKWSMGTIREGLGMIKEGLEVIEKFQQIKLNNLNLKGLRRKDLQRASRKIESHFR